jgi:hypothetical protein
VERAICALSRSDTIPLECPDFVCPLDAVQLGYPWSEIADVAPTARARNGFSPVVRTQFPPPGSIIRHNSRTEVTVTSTDAGNRSISCTTRVYVPQLALCGSVDMIVPMGTSVQRGAFKPISNRTIFIGTAFKMKGYLQNRLQGRGSATARLRKGGDKYGGTITFRGNRTKGALNNLAIVEPFSFINSSNALQVDLQVRDNTNPEKNVARYMVYCQEDFAYQLNGFQF